MNVYKCSISNQQRKNHSVNGVGVIGPIGSTPHSLFKINSTSIKTLNIKKNKP